jgi:hypothetical protein
MTCCPTPAHSPSLLQFTNNNNNNSCSNYSGKHQSEPTRFSFDNVHILEQCDDLTRSLIVPPMLQKPQQQQLQAPVIQTKLQPILTPKTPPLPPVKPKPTTTKITRQTIKELPQIPKFKKHASFPLLRRTTASLANPKLMSLELFNPATGEICQCTQFVNLLSLKFPCRRPGQRRKRRRSLLTRFHRFGHQCVGVQSKRQPGSVHRRQRTDNKRCGRQTIGHSRGDHS